MHHALSTDQEGREKGRAHQQGNPGDWKFKFFEVQSILSKECVWITSRVSTHGICIQSLGPNKACSAAPSSHRPLVSSEQQRAGHNAEA